MRRITLPPTPILAACLLLCAAPRVFADCTVYDNTDFRGAVRSFSPGERASNLLGWDNKISAAQVTANCSLTLYSDPNFKGDMKQFKGDVRTVGSLWDNQASSAVCTCTEPPRPAWNPAAQPGYGPQPAWEGGWHHHHHDGAGRHDGWARPAPPPPPKRCSLFENKSFTGAVAVISANTNLPSMQGMDDRTSSVQVPQGCTLNVYRHENFGGRSKTFVEGNYDFVGEMWEDRISSADCQCR